MNYNIHHSKGISLIEVLIVFAVVSIMMTATMPAFRDQVIREKVSKGLTHAASAQEALQRTCESNEQALVRSNLDADYFYIPSGTDEDHVNRILLGADCAKQTMAVVIWTGHTGAKTDPVIELSSDLANGPDNWACRLIVGDFRHVPEDCRTRYKAVSSGDLSFRSLGTKTIANNQL